MRWLARMYLLTLLAVLAIAVLDRIESHWRTSRCAEDLAYCEHEVAP